MFLGIAKIIFLLSAQHFLSTISDMYIKIDSITKKQHYIALSQRYALVNVISCDAYPFNVCTVHENKCGFLFQNNCFY